MSQDVIRHQSAVGVDAQLDARRERRELLGGCAFVVFLVAAAWNGIAWLAPDTASPQWWLFGLFVVMLLAGEITSAIDALNKRTAMVHWALVDHTRYLERIEEHASRRAYER